MIMLNPMDIASQIPKLILVLLNFRNCLMNAEHNPIITAGIVPSTIENTNGTENTLSISASKIASNSINEHNADGIINGLNVKTAHCPRIFNFVLLFVFGCIFQTHSI